MAHSDDMPDLLEAIYAAIRVAWPEVTEAEGGGGIWQVTQSKRQSYEDLPLPRAIVELPPAYESAWGFGAVVYEQPVVCYYADWTGSGDVAQFAPKLKLLQDELVDNGLVFEGTEFRVLSRFGQQVYNAQQRWDESMNDILMVRNNMAQAGGLMFTALVGDTVQ